MTYTNLHRLRLRTDDSGEVTEGSGTLPTHATGIDSEPTQSEIDAAQPIDFDTFTKLTADPRYRGDVMDPRPGAAFRKGVAAGYYKWMSQQAARDEHTASQMSEAERLVALNPGMNIGIAQGALQIGGYLNTEHAVKGLKEAQASGSANEMAMHEARVSIQYLEGR